MKKLPVILLTLLLLTCCRQKKELPPADPGNGGLLLPDGFDALIVVDTTGSARHLAVTEDGNIYVKFRPSYERGLMAIRVDPKTGKSTSVEGYAGFRDQGGYGTAARIYNGYLYFSTAGEVYRVKLEPGKLIPDGKVDTVLIDDYKHDVHHYEHIAKPITFDDNGHMYVPFGAPGDVCQKMNRIPGAPGEDPCSQLEEHGGIWQFDANKLHQTQKKDGKRYATGIRSVVAMAWNHQDNSLYVVAHGRDDLNSRNPTTFSRWQSAVLPSEEFLKVHEGTNAGWPYYYYDQTKGKRFLNPEYGGDGMKEGKGAEFDQPIMGFPAHWAPNDLFFYTGDQFPEHYKNGAFIAFHGSTNRAPYPQAGYFVGFVPFKNGKPTGKWEVFADGFAQADPVVNTSDAKHRPMGIAMGPDGSLYISDSKKGTIWRVMYKGDKSRFGEAQLARMEERKKESNIRTPDEINDNLDKGKTAGGERIYQLYCGACHQRNGKGAGDRFPPLAASPWVSGEKKRLIGVILNGLQGNIEVNGVKFDQVMPKHDFLKDDEVAALLTFIRSSFGNRADSVTTVEVVGVRAAAEK